jgi:hypothetical protein
MSLSQRLQAVIESRRQDPDGADYRPADYVFGDVTGGRVRSIKTAWENCKLKAHGVDPKREQGGRLSAECRAKLAEIGLHFRDLKREAGSARIDAGTPLTVVQRMLDHAKASTTSIYLNQTDAGVRAEFNRLDANRSGTAKVTLLDMAGRPVVGATVKLTAALEGWSQSKATADAESRPFTQFSPAGTS